MSSDDYDQELKDEFVEETEIEVEEESEDLPIEVVKDLDGGELGEEKEEEDSDDMFKYMMQNNEDWAI